MPFQYKPTVSRSRAGRALIWALAALWAATAHADVQASDQASASVKASTPSALVASPIEALAPMDVHPRTSLTIVEQLRHNHFLQKPLDPLQLVSTVKDLLGASAYLARAAPSESLV